MSLYLNEHERSALASIDYNALRKLIDEAVWELKGCSRQDCHSIMDMVLLLLLPVELLNFTALAAMAPCMPIRHTPIQVY